MSAVPAAAVAAVSGMATEASTPEPCGICLDPCVGTADEAINNGCEHRFCIECIATWTRTNNSCPLCKAPIKRIVRVRTRDARRRKTRSMGLPDVINVAERNQLDRYVANEHATSADDEATDYVRDGFVVDDDDDVELSSSSGSFVPPVESASSSSSSDDNADADDDNGDDDSSVIVVQRQKLRRRSEPIELSE